MAAPIIWLALNALVLLTYLGVAVIIGYILWCIGGCIWAKLPRMAKAGFALTGLFCLAYACCLAYAFLDLKHAADAQETAEFRNAWMKDCLGRGTPPFVCVQMWSQVDMEKLQP